jgi:hypothetical protein
VATVLIDALCTQVLRLALFQHQRGTTPLPIDPSRAAGKVRNGLFKIRKMALSQNEWVEHAPHSGNISQLSHLSGRNSVLARRGAPWPSRKNERWIATRFRRSRRRPRAWHWQVFYPPILEESQKNQCFVLVLFTPSPALPRCAGEGAKPSTSTVVCIG